MQQLDRILFEEMLHLKIVARFLVEKLFTSGKKNAHIIVKPINFAARSESKYKLKHIDFMFKTPTETGKLKRNCFEENCTTNIFVIAEIYFIFF